MSNKKRRATPKRDILLPGSKLQLLVEDNLGAVEKAHRGYISEKLKPLFADSLEVDQNLRKGREQENRWDYLLGHAGRSCVVGLEPHSAKDDQVQKVIRKRKAALEQLRAHFKTGARVAEWFWVASGKNQFADTEKTRRLLDQNGIRFVCPMLTEKDIGKIPAVFNQP